MVFRPLAHGSMRRPGRADAMPSLLRQEGVVRCTGCHRTGTLTSDGPCDPVADVAQWQELPCCFLAGCGGTVVPEPFN
jgi:hypothetical protein